jgi:hypothetical protein
MRRYLAVLAVVAACGGDGDGGPVGYDDLPGAVISAYCNVYVSCGLVDDFATCQNLKLDVEFDAAIGAAIDAGLVIYHADQAGACLAGISSSTCERNRLFENQPEACNLTFEGTVAGGGECGIDEECISQQCDVPSCPDACCKGTCIGDVRESRPHVGDACGRTGTVNCVDSFCDSTTHVGTAYLALGTACQGSDECITGICNGVCTALPDTGETCSPGTQQACRNIGNTCSTTTMKCVAFGLSGDACTGNAECSPIYKCGTSGTCVLGPRTGEPCGAGPGNCVDTSFCNTSGICQAPQPDGAMCTSNSQCVHDCDTATNTCITSPVCI